MKDELDGLDHNHTLDVMDCPSAVKPIGCKWIYSIKRKSNGSLDRHKARLVAVGNRQEYGIDYKETFPHVAKMTTVRLLLAIAASKCWPLYQMDVKNASLHGDLKKEVYMRIPKGVTSPSKISICLLPTEVSLWSEASSSGMVRNFSRSPMHIGFTQSPYNPSLFLQAASTGVTVLLVYVDDIIITDTDDGMIMSIQASLRDSFHIKDLGPLHYFLDLEVHQSPKGLFLNQHKYISDLIELADLHESSPVDTDVEVNLKLSKDDGDLLPDPHTYRRLMGSLVYLTITRPDISYAVNLVSQFMTFPRHLHLTAMKRIIRYLLGTITRGLYYRKDNLLHLTA